MSSISNNLPKKNRYTREDIRIKTVKQRIQRPRGWRKGDKVQELTRLKQRKILDKRCKRDQKREIRRRILSMENRAHLPTCQALNRFESQCKSKVLENSNFCKIHQFYDRRASGMAQCLGRNKHFKRCIKSVLPDEKYCEYHRKQNK